LVAERFFSLSLRRVDASMFAALLEQKQRFVSGGCALVLV
jgi:hypothetical protein